MTFFLVFIITLSIFSYYFNMDLSFKELKKREVINIADGKSYGHIKNLVISFPYGYLTGIIVSQCGAKGIFSIFDNSELFISVKKINKIGNDVILVNLNCGDICGMSSPPPQKKKDKGCCNGGEIIDNSNIEDIDLNDY